MMFSSARPSKQCFIKQNFLQSLSTNAVVETAFLRQVLHVLHPQLKIYFPCTCFLPHFATFSTASTCVVGLYAADGELSILCPILPFPLLFGTHAEESFPWLFHACFAHQLCDIHLCHLLPRTASKFRPEGDFDYLK